MSFRKPLGLPQNLPDEIGTINAYWVAKDPLYQDQYEDAFEFAYYPSHHRIVLSIADGATDSVLSGEWARILSRRLVNCPPRGKLLTNGWLRPARTEFTRSINYTALPWYAIEKLAAGSFATLAGLDINLRTRRYIMRGIGDCIIAAVGSQNDIQIFPKSLLARGAFTNSPDLIGTITTIRGHNVFPGYQKLDGQHTFFLMSDALADWFVQRQMENREGAVQTLQNISSGDDLKALVNQERAAKRIKSDDTTLLRLHLH